MQKRKHLSECGCCGSDDPSSFVFNVRHRGIYRRLCTACVLSNHPGSFCPICFEVYENPPPSPERAICLNCPSISHLSCAKTSIQFPKYQCPPCANPNFSFFDIDEESGEVEGIGKDLAKQLVAAAQIAMASMNKAAEVARAEAERTVREAAVARKRAREALERVACLASKEKIGSKSLEKKDQKRRAKIARSLLAEKRIQVQNGDSAKKK